MSVYHDVIIAGFGGQGVMLAGTLLGLAGMHADLKVTYLPVYGPEIRGGTANCTVVLSNEDIGTPIIQRPLSTIILNQPSLDKFQPKLKDNGLQVINSSLVDPKLAQTRVRTVAVAANDIADALGNQKMANMVAIGAYIKASGALPLDVVLASLPFAIASHYHHLLAKNAEAIKAGYEAV
jgi:2-oxoglutarate ferredoxin oxidoreductase subunit gamma